MIKQMAVCDECQRPIEGNDSGLVVIGNIHVLKHNEHAFIGGGLVGNNLGDGLDEIMDDQNPTVETFNHYHVECLRDIIMEVRQPITREPKVDGLPNKMHTKPTNMF